MARQFILTENVQVRLPMEIVKHLNVLAKSRLISRSDIVREAILKYVDDGKTRSAR